MSNTGPAYARMIIHACDTILTFKTRDPLSLKRKVRDCLNRRGFPKSKIVLACHPDALIVFKKGEHIENNPVKYNDLSSVRKYMYFNL